MDRALFSRTQLLQKFITASHQHYWEQTFAGSQQAPCFEALHKEFDLNIPPCVRIAVACRRRGNQTRPEAEGVTNAP
jgi:hypothetical protein